MKTNAEFDVAIIGAGAAGLQLLYEYAQSSSVDAIRILLVDSGDRAEKSWCFWQGATPIFPGLIEKKWDQLAFIDAQGIERKSAIDPLHYHYISSERFYRYFFEEFIPANPSIQVVQGYAKEVKVSDDGRFEIMMTDGESYVANQVADSRNNPKVGEHEPGLYQHFYGKFIRTDSPVFDGQVAMLMDFSLAQTESHFTCFHYLLPFSETYALLETTVFSTRGYELEKYQEIWETYWDSKYGAQVYQLDKEEMGTIPMSIFTSPLEQNGIKSIGTAAGQVKASTGYAFTRMNQDAKNIVGNKSRRKPSRFRFYDRMLLSIIRSDTAKIPMVMSRLFGAVPMPQILTFLDEKSNLFQEVQIFCKLPIGLFLKHAWKHFISVK